MPRCLGKKVSLCICTVRMASFGLGALLVTAIFLLGVTADAALRSVGRIRRKLGLCSPKCLEAQAEASASTPLEGFSWSGLDGRIALGPWQLLPGHLQSLNDELCERLLCQTAAVVRGGSVPLTASRNIESVEFRTIAQGAAQKRHVCSYRVCFIVYYIVLGLLSCNWVSSEKTRGSRSDLPGRCPRMLSVECFIDDSGREQMRLSCCPPTKPFSW